ncbi:Rossmann-like and DUF2520 domain-containing protein [Homoserinibacter gongjuensis]|uniref:DUF2520 domain-containing protein n=1 Tax=Homoserinibacter gongjuensis TaxID=1162968 RepID=A0ABQ6JRH6_9MICO|nr:Rossmann-like and DUF2520 domain-containing protein [Homoserinibacter gongjuensis]GMA90898.1 hypothetical protein GCM10025869_14270 [Homoserinibacter gongjuensis]
MTPRDGRLGVGVIGAGHVGPVLGAALGGAGHAVVGIATVSDAGRERADALLPGVPVLAVPELVERSELVLIAVPDAELPGLVSGLAAVGAWQPGQLVVHTAPGHGTGVLQPATAAGAIPLAIHPAMTFTGTSIDLARLHETWCAVTAPAPVLPIAQALVVELGAEPVVVAEAARARYGEVMAAARDFATDAVSEFAASLREAGVERPTRLLGPLIRSAVENALAAVPDEPDSL